jgi:YD repeat-containing protein
MKITYDATTDTLTVVLRDAPARISDEEKSGVILDYDANDRLIAIEVLDASTRVDGVDTVQLQVISKPRAKRPAAAAE